MVKQPLLYLLLGQDIPAKFAVLEKIQNSLFGLAIQDFNLDILYGSELKLKQLQEKLQQLPVRCNSRLVVIKNAQDLHKDIREYLLTYCINPNKTTVLVVDIDAYERKDALVAGLSTLAQVQYFKNERPATVFDLARMVESGQTANCLKLLQQLLRAGVKPEMVLGGLRASVLRSLKSKEAAQKIMRLLLESDIAIKTGKLKPHFALERLVVRLSGFAKSLR